VPSGLAAIAAALSAFLKPGDHLLISDSVYAPTRTFCEKQLRRNNVEVEYYDPLIGAGIAARMKPNTRVVFCEAPGSLTFEMQDIPAIAAVAHAKGAVVMADTTWGTPYFFRSFERGVDVSIHGDQIHQRALGRDARHRGDERGVLAPGAKSDQRLRLHREP